MSEVGVRTSSSSLGSRSPSWTSSYFSPSFSPGVSSWKTPTSAGQKNMILLETPLKVRSLLLPAAGSCLFWNTETPFGCKRWNHTIQTSGSQVCDWKTTSYWKTFLPLPRKNSCSMQALKLSTHLTQHRLNFLVTHLYTPTGRSFNQLVHQLHVMQFSSIPQQPYQGKKMQGGNMFKEMVSSSPATIKQHLLKCSIVS